MRRLTQSHLAPLNGKHLSKSLIHNYLRASESTTSFFASGVYRFTTNLTSHPPPQLTPRGFSCKLVLAGARTSLDTGSRASRIWPGHPGCCPGVWDQVGSGVVLRDGGLGGWMKQDETATPARRLQFCANSERNLVQDPVARRATSQRHWFV